MGPHCASLASSNLRITMTSLYVIPFLNDRIRLNGYEGQSNQAET
jgi:hypothetical protein